MLMKVRLFKLPGLVRSKRSGVWRKPNCFKLCAVAWKTSELERRAPAPFRARSSECVKAERPSVFEVLAAAVSVSRQADTNKPLNSASRASDESERALVTEPIPQPKRRYPRTRTGAPSSGLANASNAFVCSSGGG